MSDLKITPELVTCLSQMAQLELTETSRVRLAELLERLVAEIRDMPFSDLTEANPEALFDPRWEMKHGP